MQAKDPVSRLFEAASAGDLPAAERALAEGVGLEAKDDAQFTALSLAVREGKTRMVAYLLAKGAKVTSDSLIVAGMSAYSNATIVKLLQLAEIRQVKPKTARRSPADARLLQAAYKGNLKTLHKALADGANPNAADQQDNSALRWASRWGHRDVVEALLNAGADVNLASNTGWTALMESVLGGHEKVFYLLIARSADVNAKTYSGASVLYFARDIRQFAPDQKGAQRIVEQLEENSALYSEPEEDEDEG